MNFFVDHTIVINTIMLLHNYFTHFFRHYQLKTFTNNNHSFSLNYEMVNQF